MGLLDQARPRYVVKGFKLHRSFSANTLSVVINQLFGYQSGLGMSLITFDWSQIAYIGSPLATPWWAEGNVAIGFVLFYWFLTPILYYTNTFYAQYMPMLSRGAFDNTGAPYDVSRILNPDYTFNLEAYKAYSPLFLSISFAVSYGLSFASITATLVHVFLYYRKQIVIQARRSLGEQPDIHARLMARYPQVPDWWYLCIFLSMFAFGVIAIEMNDTEMPVWAFCLALLVAFFYTLPIGIIQAVTNQQIGLNVITELLIGYMLPGKPLAMMLFKVWGYVVCPFLSRTLDASPDDLNFLDDGSRLVSNVPMKLRVLVLK